MRALTALAFAVGGVVALACSVSVSCLWIPMQRLRTTAFDYANGETTWAIVVVSLVLIAAVSIWIAFTMRLASLGPKSVLAGSSVVAAATVPSQIIAFELAGIGAYSAGYEGGANDLPAILLFWLLVVTFVVLGVWGLRELARRQV